MYEIALQIIIFTILYLFNIAKVNLAVLNCSLLSYYLNLLCFIVIALQAIRDSCSSLHLKVKVISVPLLSAIEGRNSNNYFFYNSWESNKYMGCNTEIKQRTNLQNQYTKVKSDNYVHHKVGRAIIIWRAIEKSPILLFLMLQK